MNRNEFCPICDGAVPSEEHKGRYPGALSRFDNKEEICSLCGMAEAMTPIFSPEGRDLMVLGRENDDFDLWCAGVYMGVPQCREALEQSQLAQEQLKKLNEE